MKVTIEKKSEELKFPCLMENILNGAIVLFVGETEGTQITKEEIPGDIDLGHYSESWIASSNSEFWKPFYGQIILENSNE